LKDRDYEKESTTSSSVTVRPTIILAKHEDRDPTNQVIIKLVLLNTFIHYQQTCKPCVLSQSFSIGLSCTWFSTIWSFQNNSI